MGKRSRRIRHDPHPQVAPPRRPTVGSGAGASEITGLVFAIVGTLFGFSVGYVIALQSQPQPAATTMVAPPAAPAASGSTPVLVDERELDTLREILARDPQNLAAATALANQLYDAGRYSEAIPHYQTAFALDPKNPNISTDLGTALWYSGRPDDALAQYEKSLAADPTHSQTLFNMGIVALEGKNDPARAIDAWERMLSTHPSHPDRPRVEALLAQARGSLGDRPR